MWQIKILIFLATSYFLLSKPKITSVQDKICYVQGVFGFSCLKYAKIFDKKSWFQIFFKEQQPWVKKRD